MTENEQQQEEYKITPEEQERQDAGLIWYYARDARDALDREQSEAEEAAREISRTVLRETIEKQTYSTLGRWLEYCFELEGEIEREIAARSESTVDGKSSEAAGGESKPDEEAEGTDDTQIAR